MKRTIYVSFVVGFFLLSCQKSTEPSKPAPANIVLDGGLSASMTSYSKPQLSGLVKNIGATAGYNCGVEIAAYKNNIIIDVANGFPANLGDIPPGDRASFSAVFFNLALHSDYDRYTTKVTFLSH